jgi:hypothetical protein
VSVKRGNITKLTTEWTTPGILNIHGEISLHFNKCPGRGRRLFQIREDFGRVNVRGLTKGKII